MTFLNAERPPYTDNHRIRGRGITRAILDHVGPTFNRHFVLYLGQGFHLFGAYNGVTICQPELACIHGVTSFFCTHSYRPQPNVSDESRAPARLTLEGQP